YYPSHLDQAEVFEARGSDNLQRYEELDFLDNQWEIDLTKDLLSRDIGGGPLRMTAYDHIKHLNNLFSNATLSAYRFELLELTQYGEDYVYRIGFSPKKKKFKKARYEGELVIDYKTKAIRAFDYSIAKFAKKKLKRSSFSVIYTLNRKFQKKHSIDRKRLKIKTFPDSLHIAAAYFPFQGKWYLKRISESYTYQNKFLKEGQSTYQTRCDLVVNDIQKSAVDSIVKEDQFRSIVSNYLFYYPLSYNPTFWKAYPALITDKITEEAMQDLEQTHSLEEQFASRFQYDSSMQAPAADKIPHITYMHGQNNTDDYFWMKDKYGDASYDYISAENDFTRNYLLPYRAKQRALYYEMVDKVEKNYETLPNKIGDYYYGYRYEQGLPHEIYWRKKGSLDNPETIILDVNKLAKNYAYYAVDDVSISPDHNILAYFENLSGGLENKVRFKNLHTEQLLLDSLQNVGSMVWAENSKIIYYTQADTSKRQFQLYRYQLGKEELPEMVFEENDKRFAINLSKSKSKAFLVLNSSSKNENEVYLLDANVENAELQLVKKRETGASYGVDHYQDQFYLFSNHENPDYALYQTSNLPNGSIQDWTSLVNYGPDTLLVDFEVVGDYLILELKINMRPLLEIRNIRSKAVKYIEHPEQEFGFLSAFSVDQSDTESIHIAFSSTTSTTEVYQYDLISGQKSLVKKRKVLGTYNQEEYETQRLWAPSADGTRIPITVVYKKHETPLQERPIHVMGYGAYGINNTADFSLAHLPFLDQGGIIAYPHVRGGSELGEKWYQAGKLLCKKNSFRDFIAAVEYLTQKGYGDPQQVFASGGSAGGLLMGAVVNARPDLFKAVVLQVPFVDVLNTMLDSNLTLTTLEYQEWGNPNNPSYYEYIKSYSPYDNVKAQAYPHLLFMSAYNDGVVGYWEAAKMVAKLRATKTDDKVLLLNTKMNAGHLGASGRYEYYKNASLVYTFFAFRRSKRGIQSLGARNRLLAG
ncbi:MAG: prolyl oligopeptidase family serine peptidase, partial [Bacteroidota bacterium]